MPPTSIWPSILTICSNARSLCETERLQNGLITVIGFFRGSWRHQACIVPLMLIILLNKRLFGEQVKTDGDTASTFTRKRDFIGVATKARDMLIEPLKSRLLIVEAIVGFVTCFAHRRRCQESRELPGGNWRSFSIAVTMPWLCRSEGDYFSVKPMTGIPISTLILTNRAMSY